MRIEFCRFLILADNGYVGVEILEDPAQWVLNGKRNPCPGPSGKPRVARELNSVAKSLFPVEEKPLILQRFLAQPERF